MKKNSSKTYKLSPLKVVGRSLQILGVTLLALVLFAYLLCAILCLGPSKAARDIFVVSTLETSAAKFIPNLFFDQATIDSIVAANTVIDTDEVTDNSLVIVPTQEEKPAEYDLDAITFEDITGPTYTGKMMIVNDPSRLYVATIPAFSEEAGGMRVEDMMKRDDAIAGVNGGGFVDEGGIGQGGVPIGIVFSNGKLLYGGSGRDNLIGFDNDNRLVVGNMTTQQAKERGIRDAVSFWPLLIVNGTPMKVSGQSGGLNPRTAIGQRKDGSVLILVIDGRQSHSLGASYKDLIEIMQRYEAVNAANLDGGSSTVLIYNSEALTKCASLYGPRKLPTAMLVKRREGDPPAKVE